MHVKALGNPCMMKPFWTLLDRLHNSCVNVFSSHREDKMVSFLQFLIPLFIYTDVDYMFRVVIPGAHGHVSVISFLMLSIESTATKRTFVRVHPSFHALQMVFNT